MDKPSKLRDTLTKAIPDLAQNPEKLAIFVVGGRVVHTGTDTLSWEYRYSLRVLLTDFAGHADAVMAPLVMWMKTHQPEVFDNPDTREKAIRFEAVLSRARPNSPPGALNLIHKEEQPRPLTILQAERWEVWLRDEQLARWDYAPR